MIWKKIKEYDYMVSENGDIKSLSRIVKTKGNGFAKKKERILIPVKKNNGYYCVSLSKNNIVKQFTIHSLVAEYFVGKPNKKNYVVNHKDENKENNHYSNLEYIHFIDNFNYGTAKIKRANFFKKPIIATNIKEKKSKKYNGICEAIDDGFCKSSIYKILKGKKDNYKGWIFKYEI